MVGSIVKIWWVDFDQWLTATVTEAFELDGKTLVVWVRFIGIGTTDEMVQFNDKCQYNRIRLVIPQQQDRAALSLISPNQQSTLLSELIRVLSNDETRWLPILPLIKMVNEYAEPFTSRVKSFGRFEALVLVVNKNRNALFVANIDGSVESIDLTTRVSNIIVAKGDRIYAMHADPINPNRYYVAMQSMIKSLDIQSGTSYTLARGFNNVRCMIATSDGKALCVFKRSESSSVDYLMCVINLTTIAWKEVTSAVWWKHRSGSQFMVTVDRDGLCWFQLNLNPVTVGVTDRMRTPARPVSVSSIENSSALVMSTMNAIYTVDINTKTIVRLAGQEPTNTPITAFVDGDSSTEATFAYICTAVVCEQQQRLYAIDTPGRIRTMKLPNALFPLSACCDRDK